MDSSEGGLFPPALPLVLGIVFSVVVASDRSLAATDVFPLAEILLRTEEGLSPELATKAEAMALFARGIFDEESEGPEKATESYRKSLARDPANLNLAVRVSQEYLRRGDSAGAIGILKDAAKASPENFLPSLMLANIYLRHLGKPDLAEVNARKALALAPETFAPVEMLWEIHFSSGNGSRAEQVLANAANNSSQDPWYWVRLAEMHRRAFPLDRQPTVAASERIESSLRQAAGLGWDSPEVLTKVAEFRVLAGNLEEAHRLYSRVYELAPSHPNALEKLAAASVETGRFEEAEPLFLKMLERNPQHLLALDQLAEIHVRMGNLDKALEHRQRGLILSPYQANRHLDVLDLLLRLQRFETAALYSEKARAAFPGAGLFTFLQAVSLSRAKRPVDALPLFEKALIEASGGHGDFVTADFYFEFGVAAEQAEQFPRAADLFRKSIEMDPANAARASNYLGYMWVERGEHLEEAEELIRRALQSEPDNGAYVDSLGWLFYKQGRYAEALVELLRASELLDYPDPVVYDHIGDAYKKLGRYPEALLYWQKALQLDVENLAIRQKIESSSEQVVNQSATGSSLPAPERED
jgi:tetratricopeptide (TPR) repeat protein